MVPEAKLNVTDEDPTISSKDIEVTLYTHQRVNDKKGLKLKVKKVLPYPKYIIGMK